MSRKQENDGIENVLSGRFENEGGCDGDRIGCSKVRIYVDFKDSKGDKCQDLRSTEAEHGTSIRTGQSV